MSGLGDHSPRAMREPRTSHCEAVRVVRRPRSAAPTSG